MIMPRFSGGLRFGGYGGRHDTLAGTGFTVAGGAILSVELLAEGERSGRGAVLPGQGDQVPDLIVVQLLCEGIGAQDRPGLGRAMTAEVFRVLKHFGDRNTQTCAAPRGGPLE